MKNIFSKAKDVIEIILHQMGIDFTDFVSYFSENKTEKLVSDWLTLKEAMAYTKVSRHTLRRWAKNGLIKSSKLSSAQAGKVLISKSSLDNFLESRSRLDVSK